MGLGPLRKPPQIAALHTQRRSRIAAGLPPDSLSDSCYIVAGVLDDIGVQNLCRLHGSVVSRVLKYASVTANLEKDFLSSEPEALGAHAILATEGRATSVAPKAVKIQTTLEHFYLWRGGYQSPSSPFFPRPASFSSFATVAAMRSAISGAVSSCV